MPAPTLMAATLGHVKLPVRDLGASRDFYSSSLAPLSFAMVYDDGKELGFGPPPAEPFGLERTEEPILGVHVAFDAVDRASVDSSMPPRSPPADATTALPGRALTATTTTPRSSSTRTDTTSKPSITAADRR